MGNYLVERLRKQPKCKCGHRTVWKGTVSAFGDKREVKLSLGLFDRPSLCLNCYEKKAIKCPWCGGAIYPFEYITLYSPNDPDNFEVPEGAVVYSQDPLRLVGCQSSSCALSGADYCGIWDGDKVVRIESALEQCMRTGKPVFRNFF